MMSNPHHFNRPCKEHFCIFVFLFWACNLSHLSRQWSVHSIPLNLESGVSNNGPIPWVNGVWYEDIIFFLFFSFLTEKKVIKYNNVENIYINSILELVVSLKLQLLELIFFFKVELWDFFLNCLYIYIYIKVYFLLSV